MNKLFFTAAILSTIFMLSCDRNTELDFIKLDIPNHIPADCELRLNVYPNDPIKYSYLWIINKDTVSRSPELIYNTYREHIGNPRNVEVYLSDLESGDAGKATGFFNVGKPISDITLFGIEFYFNYNAVKERPGFYYINQEREYNNFSYGHAYDSTYWSWYYPIEDTFALSENHQFKYYATSPDNPRFLSDTFLLEAQDFCKDPTNFEVTTLVQRIYEKEHILSGNKKVLITIDGMYIQEE